MVKKSATTVNSIALQYKELNTPTDRERLDISVQTTVANDPLAPPTLAKISISRAKIIAKFRQQVTKEYLAYRSSRLAFDINSSYVQELLGLKKSMREDRPSRWLIMDTENTAKSIPLVIDRDRKPFGEEDTEDDPVSETVRLVQTDFETLLDNIDNHVEHERFAGTISIALNLLGDCASNAEIQYESMPTKRQRIPGKLGDALKEYAHEFESIPSRGSRSTRFLLSGCGGSERRKRRHKAVKLVLVKILTNLFGRSSTPATDLAIWSNVAKLLGLVYEHKNAIIRIGSLIIKHTISTKSPRKNTKNEKTGDGGDDDDSNPDDSGDDDPSSGGGSSDQTPDGTILNYIERNPWRTVGIVGLGAVSVAPIILLGPLAVALGFGAAGPTAVGFAAAIQSSIGLVEAGSLFAMMQSIGMAGAAATAGAPLLTAVGAAAGAGATVLAATGEIGSGGGGGEENRAEELLENVQLFVSIVIMII